MSSRVVYKNILWSLLGAGVPILVAIFTIPPLIIGLGDERFGVLAIGWVVMGYFVLSDLGIGLATKKYISGFGSDTQTDSSCALVWTSLLMLFFLGVVASVIFAMITPYLVRDVFKVSAELRAEAETTFFWLAASISPLLITSGLRNILEGRQRFDLTNLLKIPAGLINCLVPYLILNVSMDVSFMMFSIFLGRLVMLLAHIFMAHNIILELKQRPRVSRLSFLLLLNFGLWATLSSLMLPIYLVADRLFVASLFGLASAIYYITPYEVITKLWIISASVMGVMFPLMSAVPARSEEMARLCRNSFIIMVGAALPLTFILILYSRDILGLWISSDLAQQSGTVAKWLALGVFFNVLGQIPLTILQASGRPDVVAKVQILMLPLFLIFAWGLAKLEGTVGVAMAWSLRIIIEALLLQLFSTKEMRAGVRSQFLELHNFGSIVLFLTVGWGLERMGREWLELRVLGGGLVLVFLMWWYWSYLLRPEERAHIKKFNHILLKAK
jgi:O-antigen/teichoic acid export membrane protein